MIPIIGLDILNESIRYMVGPPPSSPTSLPLLGRLELEKLDRSYGDLIGSKMVTKGRLQG